MDCDLEAEGSLDDVAAKVHDTGRVESVPGSASAHFRSGKVLAVDREKREVNFSRAR